MMEGKNFVKRKRDTNHNMVVVLDSVVQQSRDELNPSHSPLLEHSSLFAFVYNGRT